jgi:hypothetical protein
MEGRPNVSIPAPKQQQEVIASVVMMFHLYFAGFHFLLMKKILFRANYKILPQASPAAQSSQLVLYQKNIFSHLDRFSHFG